VFAGEGPLLHPPAQPRARRKARLAAPDVLFSEAERETMHEQLKINWYRCRVDKALMSELMRRSDARALAQVIPQLLLFVATGTLAYLAYAHVHAKNWPWALPLLLLALFVHATLSRFLFVAPIHELIHKTPFRTPAWNEFFLKIYAFLSWADYVGFRISHVKHHQATVHHDEDGEVVLPQGLDWYGVKFFAARLTFSPVRIMRSVRNWVAAAQGKLSICDEFFSVEWLRRILPESSVALRREHRRWARIVVFGHLALAALFIATGHWFLIVIVTLGCQCCNWLAIACSYPQHVGLAPDVSDFRLCTRTYTCGWLPAFLYWNMQYHVEHHMFPAVPFYNLPRLRRAIEHDLPPVTHGLWATWRDILPILRRQRADPTYFFVPRLPEHAGERVADAVIQREAAQAGS
jgi:fatty acid desaturase